MISTQQILFRIGRQFGMDIANRKADAIIFIGEAIEAIGYHTGFEVIPEELTVSNYRVKKPYRMVGDEPKAVFYEGYSLPLSRNQYNFRYPVLGDLTEEEDANSVKVSELQKEVDRYNDLLEQLEDDPTNEDLLAAAEESKAKLSELTRALRLDTPPVDSLIVDSYNLNGEWIQTTFPSGTIEVHYKAFMIDEDTGFPMIVNTYKYRQAVMWYVFSRLLLSGEKHAEFNFARADEMWEIYKDQAKNEAKQPSIDMMEEFTQHWTRMSFNGQFLDKAFIEV